MKRVAILFAIVASLSCLQCVVPRGPMRVIEAAKKPLDISRAVAGFFAAFLRRIMLPRLTQSN